MTTITQYLVNLHSRDKLILSGIGKNIAKGGYAILAEGEHLHEEVKLLVEKGIAALTNEKPAEAAAVAAVESFNPYKGMTAEELNAERDAEAAAKAPAKEAAPMKIEELPPTTTPEVTAPVAETTDNTPPAAEAKAAKAKKAAE